MALVSDQLKDLTKTELASKIENMRARGRALAEKAAKPIKQVGTGLAVVGGGAAGGVVAGMKPSISKVPTDLGLGVLIALPCAFAAGNPAIDALAMAGYGMVGGSAGRISHDAMRHWREQRAAEGGDVSAQNIVALQKQIDDLRATRDNVAKKK